MSFRLVLSIFLICVFAGFALKNYFDEQNEINELIVKYHMNEEEYEAFTACSDHLSGLKLDISGSSNTKVPNSICACQSTAMTRVMLPGKYSDHENVVLSLKTGTEVSDTTINQADLKSGDTPSAGFSRLQNSLVFCIDEYYAKLKKDLGDKVHEICHKKRTRSAHLQKICDS